MSQTETLHYDGSLKLIYNEAVPKLRYQVSHKKPDNTWTIPTVINGVSSALAVVPKPFLVAWAALCAAEKAIEIHDQIPAQEIMAVVRNIQDKYGVSQYEAIKTARKKFPIIADIARAYDVKSGDAKETGTDAHLALEAYVLNQSYTPTTNGGTNAIKSIQALQLEITDIKTELSVVSRIHNYAGRFDILFTMGGKKILGDWKTNKRDKRYNPTGAHPENFLQLSAYAYAWYEEFGEWVDDVAVINVDKENGEPAIMTFASDFGYTPQMLASDFITARAMTESLKQLEYAFKEAHL